MRELLKEARDALRSVQHYIPPADETVEMTPAITADVGACQEIADRIDASLSAPKPDALEVVRKQENYTDDFSQMVSECRSHLNGVTTPRTSKSEKEHFGWIALEKLCIIENLWHGIKDSESEAAALIQPTVPMEMLEAVWDAGNEWNGSEDPLRARREDIADIAAKYGAKVGG